VSPYFSCTASSSSEKVPGGGTTTVRTIPSAPASFKNRDTRDWEMCSRAAISG